ncbi:MAG TPA: hypothetical protein GX717_01415 [Clostridiaceae bacterium]|nr:hypothetical protein [Clostridiaceae bacterium]
MAHIHEGGRCMLGTLELEEADCLTVQTIGSTAETKENPWDITGEEGKGGNNA